MKRFYSYLKADLKRAICCVKFLIVIVLAIGALLFATLEGIALDTDVLYVFSIVMYGMPAMIILVCAAAAFADSFCEDIEHKYVMQQIVRGDIKTYVSARILSIFLAAVLTIALGIFLFANILHFRLAWVNEADLQHYNHLMRAGGLRFFLKNKRYAMYFFCYGIQYGVLSGILSLWAAYLSMYVSNRMLVLASPMIIYYFVDYMLAEICGGGIINLSIIFSPSNNIFSNDLLSVLLVAGIAAVNLLLFRILMVRKLRRIVCE